MLVNGVCPMTYPNIRIKPYLLDEVLPPLRDDELELDELRDDEPALRLPTEPTVVVPCDDDALR